MITVPEILKSKGTRKLSMITCYDSSFARLLNESPIDLLLIGDSSAMVMHGHGSTVHADDAMIAAHVSAVARGAPNRFIIADMPFLSVRKGVTHAVETAGTFLRAGAHAVKIEGIEGNEDIVHHLTESGIPVMGHLGLTPQFVNAFGGMKVQAKTPEEKERLLKNAVAFERAGVFSLVLECVPSEIAARVTAGVKVPTIGIGAGSAVDGQVLVLQDLLGFNPGFKPKFLRQYLNGHDLFQAAFARFHEDVTTGKFPNRDEEYSG